MFDSGFTFAFSRLKLVFRGSYFLLRIGSGGPPPRRLASSGLLRVMVVLVVLVVVLVVLVVVLVVLVVVLVVLAVS